MEQKYYSGGKLILLNFALGLGTFIQILDSSIANVSIPYIAGNLSVSTDQGTWVITSFAASNATVLPLTGWLSDYFGRVRLFTYSVLLFSLTSFLCGFSFSLPMLVFFRILQGAVAGSLIPLSQSLLVANNPPEKRGSALGFWGMVVVIAPVLGPIIGGYITQEYSWPWIFYINVPIGIFSASIVWVLLKDRESTIVRNPIDWVGLTLLAISVGTLQILLDKGKDLDWFESNVIISLAVISLISFLSFVTWNYFEKYPIVDFSFFSYRNFTIGTILITLGYLFFFGSTVTIPLWLQTEQNYTAYWAGVAVAPIGIIPLLFSSTVGKYLSYFDVRAIVATSFALFSVGFFYQSLFTTNINIETVMFARFLQGFGVVIFFIPLVQLSLGNIPDSRYASAAGLFNFIRILVGSGFGTSLSIWLWDRLEVFHHSRLVETLTLYSPTTKKFTQSLMQSNGHLNQDVINRIADQLVEQQAFMLSTNDLSYLAAWTFLLMAPLPFFCKPIHPSSVKAETGAH